MSLSVMQPCQCTNGRNWREEQGVTPGQNDKDAVAVYEVVRGLPQDEDWDAAC